MIERQITIGCIVSTEYLQQIRRLWDINLIESSTAKRILMWVWEYYEKYNKAPGKDIETIYYTKLKSGKLSKEIAEEIEEDILPGLSKQFEEESFNVEYLLAETKKHFNERRLSIHSESIKLLLEAGKLDEAQKLANEYKPIPEESETDLDFSSEVALDRIDLAFESAGDPLILFPGQLGEFWNDALVRGGLIALMAPEKRGKTYWLLEFAMKAVLGIDSPKRKVAFFQAGDMTESQQIMRTSIWLTKKSNLERYSGKQYEPVRDCVKNQIDKCDLPDRECRFGVFETMNEKDIRDGVHLEDLIEAYQTYPEYKSCTNCLAYKTNRWGVPWIQEIDTGNPLTKQEAKRAWKEFFIKNKRRLRLSTHANETLSVNQIRAILSQWEKEDGFVPDVIIIDYADLLITEERLDERNRQNKVWKGLRRLSQEKGQPLVITATQADAASYEQNRLKLKNFSEDKRKYAHATAVWGLNQDTQDREKKIGIMRINDLIKREGDFSNTNEVTVLCNLKRGRPFLGSYW